MAKRKIAPASHPYPTKSTHPGCVTCNRNTPHIWKGERYCVAHHPDPGPHVT